MSILNFDFLVAELSVKFLNLVTLSLKNVLLSGP